MPPAVIGRIGIDNVVVAYAKNEHMILVDITDTGNHIHQGTDRFSRHKRAEDDTKYNLPILRRYKFYTSVMNNADFVYDNVTKMIVHRK